MPVLHLHLKSEYFELIKSGTKLEEYRLKTPYWEKRLANREYCGILIKKGYPKKADTSRMISRPWKGVKVRKITHLHFGKDPVLVYAIKVN